MARNIWSRRMLFLSGLVVGAALGLSACSTEEPTDFSADNRSGFMAACNRPLDDPQLVTDICRCVFAATEDVLSFGRFSAIDEALVEAPTEELPDEILDIIADCVIEATEL